MLEDAGASAGSARHCLDSPDDGQVSNPAPDFAVPAAMVDR
ncbi:hypothetical protein QFZ88_000099 [Mesorhizobium sp. YL-MeA3-2017]|jgi:hypothetical protein|nr:hypothetical protein [Mesorhizobium sp. YL-MeA3-2017]